MKIKSIHYKSSIIITIFIIFHLINHFFAFFGVEAHISLMHKFRLVYRNIFVESVLTIAVIIQIYSGIKLFLQKRKYTISFYDKLQIYSGLYLAIFFLFHLSAVFFGRYIFNLDTNFYFGAAGLNTFPYNLFFIPYYFLAITSFFAHIAAIHHLKMKSNILGINTKQQSNLILVFGIIVAFVILLSLTNFGSGIAIPEEYNIMIGK